ncbi:hypothetical protein ACS0TY_000695 [Phlomoides rotata]
MNLKSIKNQVAQKQYSNHIKLVDLHLPQLPDLPPHYHTTNGLPPHLLPTLQRAFRMAGPAFSDIVTSLNPDLVIYDYCQPWAARVASELAIPAVQFLTISATFMLHVFYAFDKQGEKFPFRETSLREYEKAMFRDLNDSGDGDELLEAFGLSRDVVLFKTGRELEGKYIDFLSNVSGKKIVPVGPFVQDLMMNDDQGVEIMQWLEKKEKKSVVYVSFGSECFLSKEEREEVAKGLELSMVSFIWVVRVPNGREIEIEEALPIGFLDWVGSRGLIVKGWAPQTRILGHPSTSGFLSHCGWNSTLESIKYGVPIIAMPMGVDQPVNARLVEAIGVGLEVVRDEYGVFRREEIAKVIKKVVKDENGEHIRRKVRQMSDNGSIATFISNYKVYSFDPRAFLKFGAIKVFTFTSITFRNKVTASQEHHLSNNLAGFFHM